jgi:salicylate hydroxylase
MSTHFETSGMNFGRRGILLTSFHNAAKDSIYVGALMQVPEIESRDGWKVEVSWGRESTD